MTFLYLGAVVAGAVVLVLGLLLGMHLADRQWMRRGDMDQGLIERGGRAFMVVDVDDQHACNAAREQIEDLQDRTLRAL